MTHGPTLLNQDFLDGLTAQVRRQCENPDLKHVATELAQLFNDHLLPVSRLQLPLSAIFGFRHPFYMGIVSSWSVDQGAEAMYMEHSKVTPEMSRLRISQSPYGLLTADNPYVRYKLTGDEELPFQLLYDLKQRGFIDYIALVIELPDGALQVLSLALHQDHPLASEGGYTHIKERLFSVRSALSLFLFGIYQRASVKQIAHTYLGRYTSQRVLEGDIYRGKSTELETFVVFADIRGFTALSERLGARGISLVVSHAFDILVESFKELGGEVLKFIGDAALLIFPPRGEGHAQPSASALLQQVIKTTKLIEEMSIEALLKDEPQPPPGELSEREASHAAQLPLHALKLSMGFGVHYGRVSYGNIGAKERLDFTVMGPAVNLAARLESLTKSLEVSALCSSAVRARLAQEHERLPSELLVSQGAHLLKGVSQEVEVWSIKPTLEPSEL
jgi:adenylate cyclase